MYEFIHGKITELSPAHAVIETAGGGGYYMSISLQTYSALSQMHEARLFVHFIVREDVQALYGFFDRTERELFRLLIGVSGVGGGTARMILSSFPAGELKTIIATGKAEILKGVKGLGIKTAQKIIVELKDKVIAIGAPSDLSPSMLASDDGVFTEAMSAMTMLGFGKAAAEKVLRKAVGDNPGLPVEDIIRIALKQM